MKILILGKGKIAEKFNLMNPGNISIYNYSIRDLISNSYNSSEFNSIVKSVDVIIYLGYHHKSFFGNYRFLLKILKGLKKNEWEGNFIFFNTQSSISESIIKKRNYDKPKVNFDIYSFTKKLQSKILYKFENHIKIFELYLPVVIGKGSNAESFYDRLTYYNEISFPNKGKNRIAYLDIDLLTTWLWRQIGNQVIDGKSQLERKLYLYEFISTPHDILSMKYEKLGIDFSSVIFIDFNLKYDYSSSYMSEIKFRFKKSILGLLVVILKEQVCLLLNKPVSSNAVEIIKKDFKLHYKVNEDEYFFYSRSIFLELVPFKVLKIYR